MHRRSASNATGGSTSLHLPPIAACFLIRFDKRVGYTISWSRAIQGLELEGEVEYKSLPSGAHHVKEDLVYFIHKGNAGLSAFVQEPDSADQRNVRFVAVGVLVPLNYGRFGRGWLHAEQLKDLATELLNDVSNTQPLEDYWQKHGLAHKDSPESTQDELVNLSESTMLASTSHDLSPYHPIFSMSTFLDQFGPLVFPIYRTALLRQRILFFKQPPVRLACEFVYILSVIATIPPALADALPESSISRITPLFNICLHDIPRLEQAASYTKYSDADPRDLDGDEEDFDTSWIACTSDELFSTKPHLSDTRIYMPQIVDTPTQQEKAWPSLHQSFNNATKATQRDLRRYRALRQTLSYLQQRQEQAENEVSLAESDEQPSRLMLKTEAQSVLVNVPSEGTITEASSWAAVVYDSYLWWASAGERSADLQEEYEHDADLFFTAADVWNDATAYSRRDDMDSNPIANLKSSGALEMAVVAYFQRMTTTIFELLARIVDATDADMDTEPGQDPFGSIIHVFPDDISAMGLDPWSQNDRDWVAQMIKSHFGREAHVQSASIECCGVKIY